MNDASFLAAVLSGFLLGGSLIVAIGAQNAFVLRQGLRREHVLPVVALCIAIDASLMTVGVSGMAASIGSNRVALGALTLAGAAFLAWYAWGALRRALAPAALHAQTADAGRTLKAAVLQTLAVSVLNPHVYLDTVLLVGALGAAQPAGLQGAFLAGAIAASATWFTALGFGARWLSPVFARPAAWRVLDGVIALVMGSLAARLVLDFLERIAA